MLLPVACANLRQQRRVLAQLRGARLEAREAPDALGRLERRARQVVAAAAGVGIEVQEPLVLLLQRREQLQQRHVLVHVREVAGVEAVAVLHCLRWSGLMECITSGKEAALAEYWFGSHDGLRLYSPGYAAAADSPVGLCLHGLMRNSRDFGELAAANTRL